MARVSKDEQNAYILSVAEILAATERDGRGMTLTEIQARLARRGIQRSKGSISGVISDIRTFWADHGVFIICDNPGDGYSEWPYRVVSSLDDGHEWEAWDRQHAVTRLNTLVNYFDHQIARATTREEKKIAKYQRQAVASALDMMSIAD